jgi:hypothetical protein
MGVGRSLLGEALAGAIRQLRAGLADPLAPITVLVPAGPNGVLARRALATQGPALRVWFETPDGLLRAQLPASFFLSVRPEPPGWLRVTLAKVLDELGEAQRLGRFGRVLRRPGWRDPIGGALARLEGELVTAGDLDALAASRGTPPHLAERAGLLSTLLRALEERRAAEAIAAPGPMAAAAIASLGSPDGVGASRAVGAVVLGDRELSQASFDFVCAWLARKEVVRVDLPALEPRRAARGLAAAAAGCPVVRLPDGGLPAELAALGQRLYRSPEAAPATARDGSVVFARTPDDVRECVECVRVIQRAVREGTPLDRIAIAVPDDVQHAALEEALARAEIPATWLIGGPARDLLAARLLRVTVDLACGEATPQRLYELLAHPALNLRAALGPVALAGRGRWRRLLSQIASARGLERIVAGIERMPHDDGGEGGAEAAERERAARRALIASTRAVLAALEPLGRTQPLAHHVRAWITFLHRLARPSEARARLLALLEPLGTVVSGSDLGPVAARDELIAILDREVARGSLTERSLRVLSPMNLMGGEFDCVCVLGLTEGRFPAPTREDALLPDELLVALGAAIGRALPLSRSHDDLERRRFAAVVGAARSRLWLSIPGIDFETERPTLPSSLVLEALTAILGRRARFKDLASPRVSIRAGSRARAHTDVPEDAVGALEHLVARLQVDPAGTLPVLASHVVARGVLQLHRSMTRVREAGLDAWTGLVPPEVLRAPGLDGTPVDLRLLVDLLGEPGGFFFRHMLGAWRAPNLRPRRFPLDRPSLEELLVEVATKTHVRRGDPAKALADAVMARLEEGRALGAFDEAALGRARSVVVGVGGLLAREAAAYLRRAPEEGPLAIATGLPWRLETLTGRPVRGEDGAVLVDVARSLERKKLKPLKDCPDLALSALALAQAGRPVGEVLVLTPQGGRGTGSDADFVTPVLASLRAVTERALAGRFPVGETGPFRLAGDAVGAAADDGDGAP